MFNARVNRILQRLLRQVEETPEALGYLGARTDAEYTIDDEIEWQPGDNKPDFVKEGLKGWTEL